MKEEGELTGVEYKGVWVEIFLSQKRYAEILTPVSQNVTFFGNRVITDIIS